MPGGRRRRLSSSSAETVDERGIRWQEETAVLKQRPDNIDSDNWPIFELHDAVVYEKKSGRMANALEVMLKGPFLVRGSVDASSKVQEKRCECYGHHPLLCSSCICLSNCFVRIASRSCQTHHQAGLYPDPELAQVLHR